MKVAFIIPKAHDTHSPLCQFSQCRVLPPLGLAKMAGLLGKRNKVEVLDERVNLITHKKSHHLVFIFINSYNQQRAYYLAEQYRKLGSFVVLTGHVLKNLRFDARTRANSIFIGQGEECLTTFLIDFMNNTTKREYNSQDYFDDSTLRTSGNNVLKFEY